jgi:EpsI family protein
LGTAYRKSLIVLIFAFILTALIAYAKPSQNVSSKRESLSEALRTIGGWQNAGKIAIDQRVIKKLDLDDYFYENYWMNRKAITLYIGYYLVTAKLGAAHDPLVCFPGQGWAVTEVKEMQLDFYAGFKYSVNYSTMIVERDQKKELVIYWFQSFDCAVADTLSQKILAFWQKIRGMPGDNALVRITVSMDSDSPSESIEIANDFIRSFYPVFLNYVRAGNESMKIK